MQHLVGAVKKPVTCNCRNSKCLKFYCVCFQTGVPCYNCKCQDCANTIGPQGAAARAQTASQREERYATRLLVVPLLQTHVPAAAIGEQEFLTQLLQLTARASSSGPAEGDREIGLHISRLEWFHKAMRDAVNNRILTISD